jgi:NAD(P)-dependent dehydrogenase (short-subunit alcohol dehydrogenase family)
MTVGVVLRGRVAVVTGASRGLGQAIAIHPGRMGAAVAVTARETTGLAATLATLDRVRAVTTGRTLWTQTCVVCSSIARSLANG